MDGDELLSAEEVGRILKLSRSTVQRWCHEGKLPAVKMGKSYRLRRKDLDGWFERKLTEKVAVQR
jgi:excisionase family DNA binding protein